MVLDRIDLKVRDYMTPNPIAVLPSVTLKDVIMIMAQKKIGNIIVNDENGKVTGIFTEREILSYLVKEGGLPEILMGKAQTKPFTVISPSETVLEAARILIELKKRVLVFDGEKPVGIITASDMLRSLRSAGGNPSLDQVMSKKVYDMEHHNSVFKAVNLMLRKRIGSVIVRKNDLPFGIFTERDLVGLVAKDADLRERLENYSTSPLITAPMGIKGNDVAEIMTKNKIKRLALEKENEIVAIVTARDIVDAFRRL